MHRMREEYSISILNASTPRPPLPVIPSDARRNARLRKRAVKSAHEPHRGEVGACTRSSVIPSDARRNACVQEHFDDAAHEPHRGEVSKARNPPAHYPLRGDPSTSLRSVFGMTYEADGRFPPVSPAIEKSRRRDCRARAALTITTLPPRFARHPPLHREGKKYKIPLATSRKNAQHFCGTFARGQE